MTYLSGGGSFRRPLLPLVIDEIKRLLKELKEIEVDEKRIKQSLENLEKKEIIDLVEKNDEIFVHLKNDNNPQVIKYSIKALLELKQKEKKWNKKWFMVFFDVPEIQRNKRDYLRKFLNKIGFYRYQKSVYIFPYECEEEINLIKKIVEGAKYMKYIIAEKIEDEDAIKTFFKL
ncbi:CRISPR-associated endonuclease Cas2 [Candidatus Roizmanbacteria bacterium CG_4_8_14_3_um_filter_34_9]|uniref:CRISPR-associated endonuclease Cas2 n=2 Tax=Candidatus Roizmaniibacteriota TaxID=1752723 RepID=A0A2M6YSD8_9BACT|nr:MAG: CRISPR-associated endonuclease Cas2 [Candidatus Roizmanbacteria bacterium CG07_land_8_20_14_0_80_34_15]PIW73331.1 MAG: CRISPR-associated endonuclease Cas2 [Candidatus Roizmanbacteria bacterium CG_4_8_14_3_um_filter_34_9]